MPTNPSVKPPGKSSDVFSLPAPYDPRIYLTKCRNVTATLRGGSVLMEEDAEPFHDR